MKIVITKHALYRYATRVHGRSVSFIKRHVESLAPSYEDEKYRFVTRQTSTKLIVISVIRKSVA